MSWEKYDLITKRCLAKTVDAHDISSAVTQLVGFVLVVCRTNVKGPLLLGAAF